MNQPPTGTITFLFTDIEGSTRLWEQHPDAMRQALARHDALMRQSIEDTGGYVFRTVGDAFCAAFPTANQALHAALTAQLALAAEPWGLPTPLLVRMALHTGTAEERGGDYFGPPLNRAARLMAAGHGGQVLISAATRELAQDSLPGLAALRDLDRHRLRDLGRPEQIFQLLHPLLPADFPPLRSLDNPDLPNNLPQQVTSFVGREKEVAEVKALLARTRLLTLTGAGGSGKTRLSLQVAADLLDGEGDGVWLVELAALSDPALVPQAVAQALEVGEEAGETVTQTLLDWLRPKRLLLILDNCEHLIAACAALAADLLRRCPDVHLLTSSREPLGITGEQTYRVPSLSLPDPRQTQTVEALSQFEAVRLFIERAQAVQPSFAVSNANAPAVAQVCWRLDGIPLALELAAARTRSLSVAEINARLDHRFRLLTGGSRTVLPRQQTLRALIDWSYDLLTESEQSLLQRLSVFAGGWTQEAAEQVCSGDGAEGGENSNSENGAGIEGWDVLDLLTSLADKSLAAAETAAAGGTRYRLLETVRQYAADRLAEGGHLAATQRRHAAWFLSLAEQAEQLLAGPDQGAWLTRLETEHDNVRAALLWGEQQPEDGETSLRLAGALWRFWQMRGHFSEGRQWLGRALERGAGAQARAKALNGAGVLAYYQGEHGVARALWEECLTLARQAGNRSGIAAALNNLGHVAVERGDYGAARTFYEESLALRRRLGDQNGTAMTLSNLGRLAARQGEYDSAPALLEEGLALYRQLENPSGIAAALSMLGEVACTQGEYSAAQALWEECLALDRQLGNQNGIAAALNSLGEVARALGAPGSARELLGESLTLFRQLGNLSGVAAALSNLGRVAAEQGEYGAARTFYGESLTLRRQLGDQQGVACSLEEIADLQKQNRPHRAARLLGAADALRGTLGAPLTAIEQEEGGKALSTIRAALGDDVFTAAWDAGRAMTPEQAAEYALDQKQDEGG